MILWKDLIVRLKRRLSFTDINRICVEHAEYGRKIEPLSNALARLSKSDETKDWFWQWQLELSPALKKISDANSREAQAHECRVAILDNIEKVTSNNFLLTFDNSDGRDYLLSIKYSDIQDTNESERFTNLVIHYTFSLLTAVGLCGLYEQQFSKYMPINEFENLYKAICICCTEVTYYSLIFAALEHYGDSNVQSTAAVYNDKITSSILDKLLEAKKDFEEWIQAGHVDGMEIIRNRLQALVDEYDKAKESAQNELNILEDIDFSNL